MHRPRDDVIITLILYNLQLTFSGRLRHFLDVVDPRTLFTSKVNFLVVCNDCRGGGGRRRGGSILSPVLITKHGTAPLIVIPSICNLTRWNSTYVHVYTLLHAYHSCSLACAHAPRQNFKNRSNCWKILRRVD